MPWIKKGSATPAAVKGRVSASNPRLRPDIVTVSQGGIGLMAVGRGDDPGPVVPGGPGEKQRELALTRD